MSWEDEDFEPPSLDSAASKRWEDEDKTEQTKSSEVIPASTKASSNPPKAKEIENKKKSTPLKATTPLDPEAERLRQKELIEEADFQNTQAMFSGLDLGKELVIDVNNPKDEKDFEVLAEVLGQKLCSFEKSIYYRHFLKNLLGKVTNPLKPEDVRDLSSALAIIINDKLKAEKPKKKKTTSAAKKTLNVKEDNDYGTQDDYSDFM